MSEIAAGTLFAVGLFVGMVILLELGRRLRRHHRMRHGDSAGEGVGAIEGAVFGLMGLLLAFTFSGAASRFDARRELVVDEANAIGGDGGPERAASAARRATAARRETFSAWPPSSRSRST